MSDDLTQSTSLVTRRSVIGGASAVAIALGLGSRLGELAAQEATPAVTPNFTVGQIAPIGQPFELGPGAQLEFLNEGQPAAAPGWSIILYRVTFQPGAVVPPHIHPGSTVVVVEQGSLSWTLLKGTVWVTRPGQAPEQVTEPNTELIVGPGEGLVYNVDVVHSAGVAGDEPAVALATVLFEVGQPFITLTDEQGTPVPAGTPAH